MISLRMKLFFKMLRWIAEAVPFAGTMMLIFRRSSFGKAECYEFDVKFLFEYLNEKMNFLGLLRRSFFCDFLKIDSN